MKTEELSQQLLKAVEPAVTACAGQEKSTVIVTVIVFGHSVIGENGRVENSDVEDQD